MYAMERIMMKKQTCVANTTTTSPTLGIHKDSQRISKIKPKIRIIHIFAPEIIKTDVANFRELVQRLTGKPSESNTKKRPRRVPRIEVEKKMSFRERVKEEGEIMWGGSEMNQNSGGFLGGFADLDGFMQELNEFPMLPLDIALEERERVNFCLAR
ncbi:VQ motif-containing protein 25-like [Actinidia eriantha]|uniref:VQ motif-containing protein 25-like n=1 Tax=Actinidia eriantha TaxID=165200 RepID=UPI0025857C5B|nr:VQ motif-containing protein 25-like [Actinidia eriantha]XP_057488953.1 VQ motif-containing protein 25-like [Actinidia eriantha]